MIGTSMRMLCAMGCIGLVALFSACSGNANQDPDKPAKAGTAEQLANTNWTISGGTLKFLPNGGLEFMPKANSDSKLTVPENPLAGNYSVTEGVLRASVANTMPFVGTWDGETLTIGDEECTRAPAS